MRAGVDVTAITDLGAHAAGLFGLRDSVVIKFLRENFVPVNTESLQEVAPCMI